MIIQDQKKKRNSRKKIHLSRKNIENEHKRIKRERERKMGEKILYPAKKFYISFEKSLFLT